MKTWHEECAVFAAWNDPEASRMTYLGLYAQQHRGQESAGIVSLKEDHSHVIRKSLGLVGEVFDEDSLNHLKGRAAVGHTRYSTTGKNLLTNTQPITAQLATGPLAIAHNGNITNAKSLKARLQNEGAIFQGTNDTECLMHLIAHHPSKDTLKCLEQSLAQLEGAFSMVVLTHDRLIVARDPYGFRPLVLGRRYYEKDKCSYVIASETCAFDLIGAEYVREIEAGELFWLDKSGEHSKKFVEPHKPSAFCVFEHVYFSRPDSVVFGESVYETRKRMGATLSRESGVPADIIIPVPDSGVPAAIGYSQESKISFELGIIRNHYIGRTFIQPSQSIRSFGVKIKLNPQKRVLSGKKVIVIDDSLVRGTTSQKIIRLIRQAGASEVHFRIASPPTTGSCYYGVDTPKKDQLIASVKTQEEIREFIGADSLAYLSDEGMIESVKGVKAKPRDAGFCAACFDGDYPTQIDS